MMFDHMISIAFVDMYHGESVLTQTNEKSNHLFPLSTGSSFSFSFHFIFYLLSLHFMPNQLNVLYLVSY